MHVLSAVSLGSIPLSSVIFRIEPLEEQFKDLLGVPEEKRLLTLIPIGVPVAWPEQEKKALEDVIHWERF